MLLGCGSPAALDFNNQTPYPSSFLADLWQQSQTDVAMQPILLNIWQKGAPPRYSHPDGRAYSVCPRGLLVQGLPDSEPNAACILEPYDGGACVEAYSQNGIAVFYARGMTTQHVIIALRYEFDSQILYQLHYDVTYR